MDGRVTIIPAPGELVTLAGADSQAGDAVYKNAVTLEVDIADASDLANSNVIGIVNDAPRTVGEQTFISQIGIVKNAFVGFTIDGKVYLKTGGVSGDTLTQTPPVGVDEALIILGVAHTATDLYVNFSEPIEL